MPEWLLKQVISGGQTGVDQTGLACGKAAGYATGGYVPKGWRTDEGPAQWLGPMYNCIEHWSLEYGPCTQENVIVSSGTVLFGELSSPGCLLTLRLIDRFKRPSLKNPSDDELRKWIYAQQITILNVAGNRLRTYPHSAAYAREVLSEGLIPF